MRCLSKARVLLNGIKKNQLVTRDAISAALHYQRA